jgi:2'-5' RNA ligase
MREESLYFIALIPPDLILEKFWNLKQEASERFGCKAALNSPPHITLHMPFRYRLDHEADLINCLEQFSKKQTPREVETMGWATFPPKVLYIEVQKTEPLNRLQADLHHTMKVNLGRFNANYKDQIFHPHVTIAFRDLRKRLLGEAFQHFSKIDVKAKWLVENVVLLKHNGSHWEIGYLFKFNA